MARSRLVLHEKLKEVVPLSPGGEPPDEDLFPGGQLRVYFQVPTNKAPVLMEYPCIKYERDDSWVSRADNIAYLFLKRYQVTVIDRDPDSGIPDLVEALPYTRFDRYYVASNLNHWVYNMYF